MTNPLLAEWDTPFGIAPFDRISDDDFAPALQEAPSTQCAVNQMSRQPPTIINNHMFSMGTSLVRFFFLVCIDRAY